MRRRTSLAAVLCSVGCLLTGSVVAQTHAPPAKPQTPRQAPAGEGIVCAWAIYTTMASVGAKCFPGKNPRLQADLDDLVTKIDAYVLRNARSMSPALIADFKRRQGHVDTPASELCQGDAVTMYQAFERADWPRIRQELDKGLARDGEPTWGTCL